MRIEYCDNLLGRQVAHDDEEPPVDALLAPLEVGVVVFDLVDPLSVELPFNHVELRSLYLLLLDLLSPVFCFFYSIFFLQPCRCLSAPVVLIV